MSESQKARIKQKVSDGLARAKCLSETLDFLITIAKIKLSDVQQECAVEVLTSLPYPPTLPAFQAAVAASPLWQSKLGEFAKALKWVEELPPLFEEADEQLPFR